MDTNDLILALQGGRKIDAIKALRDIVSEGLNHASSGTVQRVGLRECKEAVEAIFAAFPVNTSKSEYPTPPSFSAVDSFLQSEAEYMVTVDGENSTWSHTFASERAAMDYADGYKCVTVGKVIAKSVAKTVVTYTLERV